MEQPTGQLRCPPPFLRLRRGCASPIHNAGEHALHTQAPAPARPSSLCFLLSGVLLSCRGSPDLRRTLLVHPGGQPPSTEESAEGCSVRPPSAAVLRPSSPNIAPT